MKEYDIVNVEHTQNRVLDVLKGFACIGVILIHYKLPGIVGIIISNIARFAVPLFFMISGYYAYDSLYDNNKMKKKLMHIVNISIIAIFVYFIFESVMSGSVLNTAKSFLYKGNIATFVCLNNLSFIHAGHLWFLLALQYDYIIILFIRRLLYKNNFVLY